MNEPEFFATLKNRMAIIEQRVTAACQRAGRHRSEVTVIAVTKTLSEHGVRLASEAGLEHLGESRPQDLWKKAEAVPTADWHFIGHLQRNKIDKTLPVASLLHSVDSVRLLHALDAEAAKQNRVASVLLEVNASGEASKHGFAPETMASLLPEFEKVRSLQIRGLMTMAAPLDNPEECRPTFATLRALRDQLRDQFTPSHEFNDLSMGMTNDFEVAIEEGATYVRLGSVYFAGIGL